MPDRVPTSEPVEFQIGCKLATAALYGWDQRVVVGAEDGGGTLFGRRGQFTVLP